MVVKYTKEEFRNLIAFILKIHGVEGAEEKADEIVRSLSSGIGKDLENVENLIRGMDLTPLERVVLWKQYGDAVEREDYERAADYLFQIVYGRAPRSGEERDRILREMEEVYHRRGIGGLTLWLLEQREKNPGVLSYTCEGNAYACAFYISLVLSGWWWVKAEREVANIKTSEEVYRRLSELLEDGVIEWHERELARNLSLKIVRIILNKYGVDKETQRKVLDYINDGRYDEALLILQERGYWEKMEREDQVQFLFSLRVMGRLKGMSDDEIKTQFKKAGVEESLIEEVFSIDFVVVVESLFPSIMILTAMESGWERERVEETVESLREMDNYLFGDETLDYLEIEAALAALLVIHPTLLVSFYDWLKKEIEKNMEKKEKQRIKKRLTPLIKGLNEQVNRAAAQRMDKEQYRDWVEEVNEKVRSLLNLL